MSSQIIIKKKHPKTSDHGLKVAHQKNNQTSSGELRVPSGDLRRFFPKRPTMGRGLGQSIWNDTTALHS